jgi:hypothetical protein
MERGEYSLFMKIVTATDWHDGQFTHGGMCIFALAASGKSVIAAQSRRVG